MGRRKKYTGYIYCITNLINGKRYVGQTLNKEGIEKRWAEHKWALRGNYHINKHLQSAWNKYGEENFKFEVLHKLNFSNRDTLLEALNDLEVMYISIWNLLDDKYGYNIASGGSNGNNYAGKTEEEMKLIRKKISEASKIAMNKPEVKQKISEAIKGKYIGDKNPQAKKVAQYTIQGEYIKTWNCIADADRELGVNNIVACCKGQQRTAGGYRWAYIENDIIPVLEPLSNNYKPSCTPRPLAQIDKQTGEVLNIFDSISDARRYMGKNYGDNITQCATGRTCTAYGFIWIYEDNLNEKEVQQRVLDAQLHDNKGANSTHSKPVAQYTLESEFIKIWESVTDANEYFGKKRDNDNIGMCARGESKTAWGYRWAYANEDGTIPVLEPLKPKKTNAKPVAMLDKQTEEIIRVFNSVREANLYLGKPIDNDNIRACARCEQKTSWGYKWKFVSDLTQEAI